MRYCIALILLLLGCGVNAQQSFFSQHSYAVSQTAPAMIAIDDYASASLLYKNQKLVGTDHLISTLLFAKYPIVNHKNNRLALGVTFTENKIKGPGKLTEQLFSSTLAYSFNYAKHEGVSFAMDVGLVTKKVNLNDIQTGAMWTIENGVDPGLSSGENIENEKLVYPKLNASIYWFANDRNEDVKSYFGFTVFQLNKFNDSFYNTEDRTNNKQFTALGGFRVYDKNQIALTPKFIITSTTSRAYVKLGMDFNYSLSRYRNNVSREENSFNVEVNYQVNKGVQFGLQYLQPRYIVGMAYHFDISNKAESNVFNNAVEVLFVIRSPVEISPQRKRFSRKNKRRSKKKKTPKDKKQPAPEKTVITLIERVVETDSTHTQNASLIDTIGIVTSQPSIIEDEKSSSTTEENWETSVVLGSENSLQFEYNSTQINDNSYQKLAELATLLQSYSKSHIVLIGHTDNLGSASSNKEFSIKRAKAAAKVLIELGTPSSKIVIQGKGELEPIDSNSTEKGRSNNRRIEFYLIND